MQSPLCAAAVAERAEDGDVAIHRPAKGGGFLDTVEGSLVGSLIGLLGGPLGVLIGGTSGAFVGSLGDVHRHRAHKQKLAWVADAIPLGAVAVLAELYEPLPGVVDSTLAQLGGITVRRPAEQVAAEVEVVERVRREVRDEVRAERREGVRQAFAHPIATARGHQKG